MYPIQIIVTSDFICPWCWIGHHNLHAAIRAAEFETAPNMHYVPYELNPGIPTEGLDRRV